MGLKFRTGCTDPILDPVPTGFLRTGSNRLEPVQTVCNANRFSFANSLITKADYQENLYFYHINVYKNNNYLFIIKKNKK